MAIRGDIIGEANSGKTAIDKVKFTQSSAAQALDAVLKEFELPKRSHVIVDGSDVPKSPG